MSETKYKYSLNDVVSFDMGNGIKGTGKIKGCSTEPMPEIGRGWILELQEPYPFDMKVYPFTNIVIFDVMIKDPTVETTNESVVPEQG